jgi:SAM-dependent methyltransferase
MNHPVDTSAWYGAHYFQTYRDAPYERSTKWLGVFGVIADGIVREIAPKTVLDVGCAMGFLVEHLRDRGVEAQGIDISGHAIAGVRDDIKPSCRVASILEPVPGRYDLVVCLEVVEHLPETEAHAAVGRLCGLSDDVLFSSTPGDFGEDTHINVQPPEYWAGLFAAHGFIRDLDFDASAFLAPWACRYRRNSEPARRVTEAYERRLWALEQEVRALRTRGLETAALLARQDEQLRQGGDVVLLEETVAEQQQHLDALNDRLTYMSDHESELRRLLIDAHRQILERDTMLQALSAQVAAPHAAPVTAPSTQAQSVLHLQHLVDERTAWAQRAVAELEECRKVALERQALIEERTTWAQRAVAELEASRQTRNPLRALWRRRRPDAR